MDCRTGEIHRLSAEDVERLATASMGPGRHERRAMLAPLSDEQADALEPMDRPRRKNWMRNQPCPCGSAKKFKRCCCGEYA